MRESKSDLTGPAYFFPLHEHPLDAAVGNEPQEGDEHIPAAGNPRTHKREQDRQYWLPLKAELEKLRHAK